jgi:hypothetical protein
MALKQVYLASAEAVTPKMVAEGHIECVLKEHDIGFAALGVERVFSL